MFQIKHTKALWQLIAIFDSISYCVEERKNSIIGQ